MNPKSKLFLVAAAGGAAFLMFSGSKKANASEAEEEEVDLELPDIGPPVEGVDELEPPEPGAPPKFFPSPNPDDFVPPKKPIPEDPEAEESENPPELQVPLPGGGKVTVPVPAPPVFSTQPLPSAPVKPPKKTKSPAPPPIKVVPPPTSPPEPDEPEQTTELPADTAQLLRVLLARETAADWKRAEAIVGAWQKSRGMTSDKKFGPGTALALAEETGLLPIVRFWPKGSLKETGAVDDYQQALFELAGEAEEPRRAQLQAAAEREQGQGFDRNPTAISPTISI